ncbi:MAG: electron transfer flavoprotein subunit alpha [Rhodospirillaceae bacterium]|nr:MAG: electron transfer flavoprotein subunit alpha [Rhodospirillaceae bacterium]
MRTLVLAEHNNIELNPQTLNTVTCAKALGSVDILVAGKNCGDVAQACAEIEGVQTVLIADDVMLAHALAETLAPLLVSLAEHYDAILAPATSIGKNVLPRVAAVLDVQQISDICEVVNENTFKRPIYAGNAIQTVQSRDAKKIITVRTTTFEPANPTGGSATLKNIDKVDTPQLSTFVGAELSTSDRPDLASSAVIVSGGRGLGSVENFALLETLADILGGAIGASRAAVDAGFATNDHQIGQTGKVVAPDLYIAVGISGAIQHLAGMKDSRTIVAINSDPDAPIFKIADYGLVADLFDVLPELAQALKQ